MKTPEDIKKGLECCMTYELVDADKCPYGGNCNNCGIDNMQELKADALTYIRMLETELMLRCKTNYRYYIVNQNAERSLATCLRVKHEMYGGLRYVSEIDGMAYGWFEFSEPMSPEQMHMYGLISAPVE